MHFEWNEKIKAWFVDASEYTGYEKKLADTIFPHIKNCETLCDMGCGMALTDFALADRLKEITCVDLSEGAVNYVNQRAKESGVDNIHAFVSDGISWEGTYDAVMSLYSAPVEAVCDNYFSKALKKLIIVTHDTASIKNVPYAVKKCSNVEDTSDWLEHNGYNFELERHCLDFSQPHRSFEEAVDYTRTFTHGAPEEEIEEITRSRIVETGDPVFPYRTPKTRHFGLFVISK